MRKDMRHPSAKARDEWINSDAGQKAVDASTLTRGDSANFYLKNRLESAFAAGYKAAQDQLKAIWKETLGL